MSDKLVKLNYDLTYFYENKLSKEMIVKRKLEDKEREITMKLEDINFNVDKIKGTIQMIGESETLSTLRFGMRAKKIENKPKINKEISASELKQEIDR